MTVLASWQSHIDTQGGRVCAWFDTAGTMGLRIAGQVFEGSATNDGGIAYCDFSLPGAGDGAPAEILLDGEMQPLDWNGALSSDTRDVWRAVDGALDVVWISCANPYRDNVKWAMLVRRIRPRLVFFLGDTIYHEPANLTHWAVTRNNPEGGLSDATAETDEAWNAQRMFLRKPSTQLVSSMCPIVYQWDDHEILSDFRNDLAGMQAQFAWIDTEQKLADVTAVRKKLAAGVLHPWADESAGPFYRSVRYGPAHFIVPDLVSEAGARLGTTKMSATQLAWYKRELGAGTPFVFGMHTKTATDGNADSWYYWGGLAGVGSQLREILDHIESNQIATFAVLTGDLHCPHVQYNANPLSIGAPTDYSPYLGVCPCPENQFFTTSPTTADIIWKRQDHAIGHMHIPASQEYAEYSILNVHGVMWRGRQLPGSNALTYATRVGL